MTDDRRQQDFAERLSRISQERGGSIAPDQDSPKKDISDFNYNMPRESHPIRNGIIWLLFLAAAGTGGYYGWNALPQDLRYSLASLATSGGGADGAMMSAEAIPETDTMSDQGPIFASPRVAHTGSDTLSVSDIVTEASLPTNDMTLGTINPIIRNERCELRAVGAAEKVTGVRIENALLSAPLYAFSDQQLADQMLENVKAVTRGAFESDPLAGLAGEKTSLDVFVTDTSAPLYLVLQNMGPGVIWNLQVAPNVEIAHVAIIGSDYSGVANLPADTTVEALLVGDFIAPHQYGADDTPRSCMIRPWRMPQADWIGSMKSEAGSLVYQNQLYSYTKGYEAYNRWFMGALGVDAATNMVTARDAAHVLLGPVPAASFAYSTLAGQDVQLMEAEHLITGNPADRAAEAERLHRDLLTAALGGDIAALNPPAMERNSQ